MCIELCDLYVSGRQCEFSFSHLVTYARVIVHCSAALAELSRCIELCDLYVSGRRCKLSFSHLVTYARLIVHRSAALAKSVALHFPQIRARISLQLE